MRRRPAFHLPQIALAVGALIPVAQAPQFSGRTDIVAVHAAVTSEHGFPVLDLRKEDFELWDSGTKKAIVQFSVADGPIAVAVLIDTSGSHGRLAIGIAPVRALVDGMRSIDRASVSTLTSEIAPLVVPGPELIAAMSSERASERDRSSPVWAAVERSIRSLTDATARRAVLMFTDGQDDGLGPPPLRLTTLAREVDVALYAVTFDNGLSPGGASLTQYQRTRIQGGEYLKNLARITGGRVINVRGSSLVPATFRAFAEELRHQYVLGFVPDKFDGKFHETKVRILRPGLTVTSRAGYVAEKR